MAWVRIHDGAMGNLKILRLSDSAFRLWVHGLCYCQTNLTDGLIPREALRMMAAKRIDVDRLSDVIVEGKAPLWEPIEGFGFKVHDYLEWNDSRDVVLERQGKIKERKEAWKAKRRGAGDATGTRSGTRSETRPEHDSGDTQPNLTKPNLTKPVEIQQQQTDARSKRPIYKSDRFAVFEWQLDDLSRMLGIHLDGFDLHKFFDDLSQQSRDRGLVIPADRDARWKWLQAQVEAEARRRGLPMATVETAPAGSKRVSALIAGGQAFLNRGRG